jgi:hypothetical protein
VSLAKKWLQRRIAFAAQMRSRGGGPLFDIINAVGDLPIEDDDPAADARPFGHRPRLLSLSQRMQLTPRRPFHSTGIAARHRRPAMRQTCRAGLSPLLWQRPRALLGVVSYCALSSEETFRQLPVDRQ